LKKNNGILTFLRGGLFKIETSIRFKRFIVKGTLVLLHDKNKNIGRLIMLFITFGVIAIVATLINLYMYKAGKDYKLAMAIGLSFTALTLCSEYSLVSRWVKVEDWSALGDVVPGMERALWFLTIVSILLNIAPILLELKGKK